MLLITYRNMLRSFLVIPALVLLASRLFGQGLDLQVDMNGHGKPGDTVLLAYYYKDGRYVADSGFVDSKGHVRYQQEKPLMKGVYLLIWGNDYIDILLGEDQDFKLKIGEKDYSGESTVKGAPECADFLRLQVHLRNAQQASRKAYQLDSLALSALKARGDTLANGSKKRPPRPGDSLRKASDEAFNAYMDTLKAKYNGHFLWAFAKTLLPIHIPTPPDEITHSPKADSLTLVWQFYYNLHHYMDNYDLASPDLLRTPNLYARINYFLDHLIAPMPDTISLYCDRLMEAAAPNDTTLEYMGLNLLNKYQLSEIMGQDAIFVHLAEKYFLNKRIDVLSEETMGKLRDRVEKLKPNLIGQTAPDFTVETLYQTSYTLSQDKAKAFVLVFWEPSCPHCKVLVPKLDSVCQPFVKKGVHIIGFMTQGDGPKWLEYVQEHKLSQWTHVWDPYRKSNFSDNYDIYSTPVIYILDQTHKIVAKRIGVENVQPLLDIILEESKP